MISGTGRDVIAGVGEGALYSVDRLPWSWIDQVGFNGPSGFNLIVI